MFRTNVDAPNTLANSKYANTTPVRIAIEWTGEAWVGDGAEHLKAIPRVLNYDVVAVGVIRCQLAYPTELWILQAYQLALRVGDQVILDRELPGTIIPSVQVIDIMPGRGAWLVGVLLRVTG
jgi:hypothetical protein